MPSRGQRGEASGLTERGEEGGRAQGREHVMKLFRQGGVGSLSFGSFLFLFLGYKENGRGSTRVRARESRGRMSGMRCSLHLRVAVSAFLADESVVVPICLYGLLENIFWGTLVS